MLPIEPLLPQIVAVLREGSRLVLQADPGAGKTTRVPVALLDAGLHRGKQIVVLEPRRIAARAAAEIVSSQRRQQVGEEVGYRVRFEQRGGARTRLWFVTEGMFGRQLIHDPFLEEVGVVVLDEFHERHLQGDVALAVVRELQATVRPDLKLVVMSATLQSEPLAAYLDACPVLVSQGRAFPVDIAYDPADDSRPLPARIVGAVERAFATDKANGDALVFLPGAGEIRRVVEALQSWASAHGVDIVPLHGDLPLDAQRRAIDKSSRRRVVLSTNVAETALTVEGVTTVIDSGLAREARLDRRHGINSLQLVPISRASADQRAGRAGRTQPGRCLRLWTKHEHDHRRAFDAPEIRRLDLAATLLELRAWGLCDSASFRWLDAPEPAAVARAEGLLRLLGAIDSAGTLTEDGRRMLAMAVHPRLGRMLVEAQRRGCVATVALIAALASERDILLEQRAFAATPTLRASGPSDLLLRVELFEEAEQRGFERGHCQRLGLDTRCLRAVARARQQLLRGLRVPAQDDAVVAEEECLRCVLAGFPDRVVRRREPGGARGVMVGGTGVVLDASSVVRDAELFVAVEMITADKRQAPENRVRVASAIREEWLRELFPRQITQDDAVIFDAQRQRVLRRRRECFADLMLREHVTADVERDKTAEVLALAVRQAPHLLERDPEVSALLARIAFLRRVMPEAGWSDPESLRDEAITAACSGCVSIGELRQVDLTSILLGMLPGSLRASLDRDAPARLQLPSGRSVPIDYAPDKPPHVAGRVQEFFGVTTTPRLAGGRIPVVIELLAPNQRPVQITEDLASFWRNTYPEVRKTLRGRYPKHLWPEDPFSQLPTARVRRS